MRRLTFRQAGALADLWLARVTASTTDEGLRGEARHLRYLVQCHRTHFELHGLDGRGIDDPRLQATDPQASTRARLQALCAVTRRARRAQRRAA